MAGRMSNHMILTEGHDLLGHSVGQELLAYGETMIY